MDNKAELISDYQVASINSPSKNFRRKRKIKADCLTPEYRQRMKRMAAKDLTQWISTGVPESCAHWSELSYLVLALYIIWIKRESITN